MRASIFAAVLLVTSTPLAASNPPVQDVDLVTIRGCLGEETFVANPPNEQSFKAPAWVEPGDIFLLAGEAELMNELRPRYVAHELEITGSFVVLDDPPVIIEQPPFVPPRLPPGLPGLPPGPAEERRSPSSGQTTTGEHLLVDSYTVVGSRCPRIRR